MQNIFFNACHSPVGAYSSFTVGYPGRSGGLGSDLGRPALQDIYIGCESHTAHVFEALPFYKIENWEEEAKAHKPAHAPTLVKPFHKGSIHRNFQLASDVWTAGDLSFRILTPIHGIPNPATARPEELQMALMPAILVEMTLDNTHHGHTRKAFFGFAGTDPHTAMRRIEPTQQSHIKGIAEGRRLAILSRDKNVHCALGTHVEELLAAPPENDPHVGTGTLGLLWIVVPPHRRLTVRFVVCFFREGAATAGLDARYYYTDLFKNIEEAGAFALDHFIVLAQNAAEADARVAKSRLSSDQKLMLAHSIRTYYANTQLLLQDRKPVWIVNDGESRMMNTMDAAADYVFFEAAMNPWVIRTMLDQALEQYCYHDRVCFPGNPREYPGGIAFAHDMGIGNCFMPPGRSVYEQPKQKSPSTFMTHEQLVNWICCAGVYFARSNDLVWARKYKSLFMDLLTSLLHRDHPNPARRNGVMKLDTCLAAGGTELTTYGLDDVTLGQARNNIYMAVKTWAAYLTLERLLAQLGLDRASGQAGDQARRCALTLHSRMTSAGFIPAIIDEKNDAKIIPAIEGLVFPYFCGWRDVFEDDSPYADLIKSLKRHLQTVLTDGICLFNNGAWKLSSTGTACWLSKTFLCEFVARQILKLSASKIGRDGDALYVNWLLDPQNAFHAWCNVMDDGVAIGAKGSPRGVTSYLWLLEERLAGNRPTREKGKKDA